MAGIMDENRSKEVIYMQYRADRYGNPISILGYGCMRFTLSGGKVDVNKAEKEIMEAYRAGVNYYDTAYVYHGSEAALGEILARNGIREKVNIATKLPHYLIKKPEGMEQYFSEELRRLKTDHVDYYLMHMLTDVKTWDRLVGLGILSWLEEKKRTGQIRQVGFSYHGNSDMFCKLLEVYDWDFCQIQYNYLDENSQAGVTGLRRAAEKGLPVIIMEPLRGGRLTGGLPAAARHVLEHAEGGRTSAQWAFQWLWNQPEVTCVLSGMNSLEMVRENVATADAARADSLTEADLEIYRRVVAAINEKMKVGCTGCRYCMPCPRGVDIPGTFAAYNRRASDGYWKALTEYFMITGVCRDYTGPGNCIGCGKCEQHCPQHLPIRQELQNAKKAMEGLPYRVGRKLLPHIMHY